MHATSQKNSEDEGPGEVPDEDDDNNQEENKIMEISPKGRFARFEDIKGKGGYKTVYAGIDNDSGCEIAWNVIKLSH